VTNRTSRGQGKSVLWPSLDRTEDWVATQDYLHLCLQMLGKLKVALAPPLPEWAHTSLDLTARGLTTGVVSFDGGSVEATLDVIDGAIRLITSDGRTHAIALLQAKPIAELWGWYTRTLAALGITVQLWDKPQERRDTTPMAQDDRPRSFNPDLASSWFALLTDLRGIFDDWRSTFFGRTTLSFWWGSFDFTVALYNGRHGVPRAGSDYIMRFDLDAEHLSAGFWPGDKRHDAMFCAYLVPEPPNCAVFPLDDADASWAQAMGEWVLPYRSVRDAEDRRAVLRGLMDTVLRAAGELAGWDLESLTYAAPPPRLAKPITQNGA
jgi:hypothetical protein